VGDTQLAADLGDVDVFSLVEKTTMSGKLLSAPGFLPGG